MNHDRAVVLGAVCVAVVALPSSMSPADTQQVTWAGPSGGLWNNPLNWSPNVVPLNTGGSTYSAIVDVDGAASAVFNQSGAIDALLLGLDDQVTIANAVAMTVVGGSIAGDGMLLMGSQGNLTDLVFAVDAVLGDAASIAGSDTLANRIYGGGPAVRLTVGADAQLFGAMTLGASQLRLTNSGLIQAEGSAGIALGLTGGTGMNFNTGVIRAAESSGLTVSNCTIENNAGTIAAGPASIVQLNGATVTGGILIDEDGTGGSGAIRNASVCTLDGVSIVGDFLGPNSTTTFLRSDIEIHDRIRIESIGNYTDLVIDSPTFSLNGGGEVVFSNTLANRFYGLSNMSRLVVPSDFTIRGAVSLGVNQTPLTNNGLIRAEGSAGMVIDLTNGAGVNFNTGVIRAAEGSGLLIQGTTLENAGGTLAAGPGTLLQLNDATIVGGSLVDEDGGGDGAIRNASVCTLDGVNIVGEFLGPNSTTTVLRNDTEIHDCIRIESFGNLTDLRIDTSPFTLNGGGELLFNNTLANRLYGIDGSNRLVVPAEFRIRGGLFLGANQLTLTNHGLIQAEGSSGILVDLTDGVGPGTNFNTGLIRAAEGSGLTLQGFTLENAGGTVAAGPGALVQFNNATVVGGTLLDEDGALGAGALRNTGSCLLDGVAVQGDFLGANATLTLLRNTIDNQGRIRIESLGNLTDLRIDTSPFILSGGGELLFSDTLANRLYALDGSYELINGPSHVIHGSASIGANQLRFRNQGTIVADASAGIAIDPTDSGIGFRNEGVLLATGGSVSIANGPFENIGDVLVDSGRTLTRTGAYLQTGGSTSVKGTLAAASVQLDGGVLSGSGTVNAPIANAGGKVAPGDSAGVLTVNGSYAQGMQGVLAIDIGGPEPGAFDRLEASGNATLAGTLNVVRSKGYAPPPDQVFEILAAASRVGEFDAISSCDVIEVVYTATSVQIRILNAGSILGDLDDSGAVDGADLGLLLGLWGPCGGECCPADLTGDAIVNGADLGVLLGNWG